MCIGGFLAKHHKKKIEKHKEEHKEQSHKTKKRNVWRASFLSSTIIIAVLLIIILSGLGCKGFTGKMSADAAGEKALNFIKDNLVRPGTNVSINDVEENNGLYKITFEISAGSQSQEVESYITEDGKMLFPSGIDMVKFEEEKKAQSQTTTTTVSQSIQKSDKPVARAFVMSHCPYGLQFLKAYIPVMELLGDKADLEVNFVNYIMHGEDEMKDNTRIYCVQKEARDKLTDYLRCYVEKHDYENCLQEAGIDKTSIDTCIQDADTEFNITKTFQESTSQFPPYPVDDALNKQYGVRGSPTFVINGKTVSVARSPEAIKEAICSAFNNPPSECQQTLSSTAESPGFGPVGSGSGSSSGGGCGA